MPACSSHPPFSPSFCVSYLPPFSQSPPPVSQRTLLIPWHTFNHKWWSNEPQSAFWYVYIKDCHLNLFLLLCFCFFMFLIQTINFDAQWDPSYPLCLWWNSSVHERQRSVSMCFSGCAWSPHSQGPCWVNRTKHHVFMKRRQMEMEEKRERDK